MNMKIDIGNKTIIINNKTRHFNRVKGNVIELVKTLIKGTRDMNEISDLIKFSNISEIYNKKKERMNGMYKWQRKLCLYFLNEDKNKNDLYINLELSGQQHTVGRSFSDPIERCVELESNIEELSKLFNNIKEKESQYDL